MGGFLAFVFYAGLTVLAIWSYKQWQHRRQIRETKDKLDNLKDESELLELEDKLAGENAEVYARREASAESSNSTDQ